MDLLTLLVFSVYYNKGIWFILLVLGFFLTLGSKTKIRIFVLAGILIGYPIAMTGYRFIRTIPYEYRQAKTAWLNATCKKTMSSPLIKSPPSRIYAEGVLLSTNYNEIVNSQGSHPIEQADGGGRTFDEKAYNLLTQKNLSYVEIEMIPEGGGEYSNMGWLDSTGWSGKRYRLYHLAPANHVNCVYAGNAMPFASHTDGAAPPSKTIPYCMAMEVTNTSISNYQTIADRQWKLHYTPFTVKGITLPAWLIINWDLIRLANLNTGEEIAQYRGFDYPNTGRPHYKCNNKDVAESIMSTVFDFDKKHDFLNSRKWYEESEVQRFYEPHKFSENNSGAHKASDSCPTGKPKTTNPSIVVDQLDDHSIYGGEKTYTESNIAGSQLASLFRLTAYTRISLMEWSGMLREAGATEKFLIRIFSGDAHPEQLAYESEVTANVKSITNINKSLPKLVHVFSFKPTGLALPAGTYWISITSRGFFWGQELSASSPVTCGSGGATRRSDISNWTTASSNSPTPRPAESAPGFSFRLTANPGSR